MASSFEYFNHRLLDVSATRWTGTVRAFLDNKTPLIGTLSGFGEAPTNRYVIDLCQISGRIERLGDDKETNRRAVVAAAQSSVNVVPSAVRT